MAVARILIVDSPAAGLWSLAAHLRSDDVDVREVRETAEALAATGRDPEVLCVHAGTAVDVTEVVASARAADPALVVLVLLDGVRREELPPALATAEVVASPFNLNDLARRLIGEAMAARHRRRLRAMRRPGHGMLDAEALIGASSAITRIRSVLRRLPASSGAGTLITGERGSGRGFIARILHDISTRATEPFIRVDCGPARHSPLAPDLLGDGATGAPGAFECADDGTLVVDNVEHLPPHLQAALLRVCDEGVFCRVGGVMDHVADLRIVVSTTADLEQEVEAGRFRRDLYYRLNVVRIDVPSLRRRGTDVVDLALHFAAREGLAHRGRPVGIDDGGRELLVAYQWPGNVRELRQVVERAVILATGDLLSREDLGAIDRARPMPAFALPPEGVPLHDLERRLVVEALERTGGNQTHAAQLLGLHRDQIRYRMLKYGLRR